MISGHAGLVVLLALPPLLPGVQEDTPALPPPGTREYALEVGPGLLQEHKWEEAARVLGGHMYALERVVWTVWQSHTGKPEEERHRFLFHLTNFFFRRMDLSRLTGETLDHLEEIAEGYPIWSRSVPPGERGDTLDFSRLELLTWARERDREAPIAPEEQARVLAALKASPDSICALYAFVWAYHRTQFLDEAETLLLEGEKVMKTPFSRRTLVRLAAQARKLTGTHKRIVEEGLPLEETDEYTSYLLYMLGRNLQDGLQSSPDPVALQEARSYMVRAYEAAPLSAWAEDARFRAVSLLCRAEGREAALAEIRRLKAKGEEHKAGLDGSLLAIARDMEVQKDRHGTPDEGREVILLEVARDYPGTHSAGQAMFALSQIEVERGNRAGEIEWLKKCALIDPPYGPAMKPLAEWYEEKEEWDRALGCWRACTVTGGWCGNALEKVEVDRFTRMVHCQKQLADYPGLVETCVETLPKLGLGWKRWDPFAIELVRLYRDAGQLEDLQKIIDEIEGAYREALGNRRPKSMDQILQYTRFPLVRRLIQECMEGKCDALSEVHSEPGPEPGSLPKQVDHPPWDL